jgi:hypothetical protein
LENAAESSDDISEEQFEEKAFTLLERMPMSTSSDASPLLVAFLTPQREEVDHEDENNTDNDNDNVETASTDGSEWPSNLKADQVMSNAKAIGSANWQREQRNWFQHS